MLFTTSSGKARTEMLTGVREFASGTDWNVQVFEYEGAPFPIAELIRFWKPAGCIVEGSGNCFTSSIIPRNAFSNVPVVYIGSDPMITPKNATIVIHDARAAAILAARELLQRNPKTLSFLGMKSKVWSERRKSAFIAAVRLNGKTVETLDIPISGTAGSNTASSKLKAWLKRLEKPVGLFAADDTLAEMALSICRVSGISSPDELIDARIALAKSLLAGSSLPVSAIAEQCGYRFQTQFRRIFLKATGLNPLHWRQCAKRGLTRNQVVE